MNAVQHLFPHMSPKPQLPRKLYQSLAPSNPFAVVRFSRTIDLMYTRQLSVTLRDEDLANIRANSTWLMAFEMLEARGLHLGLHVSELAEAKGITPAAAKRAMLRAEEIIFQVYGINISFIDNNGRWRLATEREVAVKYAEMLRVVRGMSERLKMYRAPASDLGKRQGTLNIPLFTLEDSN